MNPRRIISLFSSPLLTLALIMVWANCGIAQSLPSGIVASYFLDERSGTVATDGSGNGRNGTLLNGPVWTDGRHGAALEFDGVNDYVSIPSGIYSLTGGTLSLWFMKTGAGSGANVIIGSWGGGGNMRSPTFFFPGATLGWEFGSLTNRNTGQSIVNGQWYHVAMTYDASFNVNLYLNGALVATGTSSNPGGFFGQVHIGHYANYGTHYFQGRIDEVLIWNRPLTAAEVQYLYNR